MLKMETLGPYSAVMGTGGREGRVPGWLFAGGRFIVIISKH